MNLLNYSEVLDAIKHIDPKEYSKTRNYTHGAVSGLSPYVSRGFITVKTIFDCVEQLDIGFDKKLKLYQQLAWREYFQRVWQHLGEHMFNDIKQNQVDVENRTLSSAIIRAQTGIKALDEGIVDLYTTGYIHNHLRLYIASVACNVGKSHWLRPSKWMYYHLFDGDIASNTLSWQWVAGTHSSKKYFANQENINHFTNTIQKGTFLDADYEHLFQIKTPALLQKTEDFQLKTKLPENTNALNIDLSSPTLIYTNYNLDPMWRRDEKANRILLLEPSHFENYPISEKVLNFILELSKNIPNVEVFVGEFSELKKHTKETTLYFKEHPAYTHFSGVKDEREWIFPDVNAHFTSFFKFWKKAEKQFKK